MPAAASGVVCLIGMPGSGKSTIGPLLADRLGVGFADLDAEIERREAREVAQIFAADGESGFRRVEAEVLRDLVSSGRMVVACGGGVVTTGPGRAALVDALVVMLEVDLDVLEQRIAAQAVDRPLLAGDLPERLATLARDRHAIYLDVADLVVDASGPPDDVVAAILESSARVPSDGARG